MYLFKAKHIVYFIGFLLMGYTSQAQISDNANKIFIQWQSSNCGINEDDVLIRTLLENVVALEPLFIDGFREGPSKDYLQNATTAELKRFRENRKLLADPDFVTGLSKEDLQVAASIDVEAEKDKIEKRVVDGWKSRALTGLYHLNTKTSIRLVEEVADNQDSAFNSLAKFLLGQDRE